MPSYQPTIPQGNTFLNVDYQNIQNNFQALDDSFGINHIKFSEAANNGRHTFVEMLNTAGNLIPTPLANFEGTSYTKSNGTISQLWYTPDTTGHEYQMTRVIASQFAKFGVMTNNYTPQAGGGPVGVNYSAGWTFLPGNILVQYGTAIGTFSSGGTNGTVKFPLTFTGAPFIIETSPFYAAASTPGSTGSVGVQKDGTSPTTTQFSFRAAGSSSYTGFYWIAIGV